MELTDSERDILRTFSGYRFESRQIRRRLKDAGLKYCLGCDSVKGLIEFSYSRHQCKPCDARASREYHAKNIDAVRRRQNASKQLNRNHEPPEHEPDPSDLLGNFDSDDLMRA